MRIRNALGRSVVVVGWVGLVATDLGAAGIQNGSRTFRFTYETTIGPIDAGSGPVR